MHFLQILSSLAEREKNNILPMKKSTTSTPGTIRRFWSLRVFSRHIGKKGLHKFSRKKIIYHLKGRTENSKERPCAFTCWEPASNVLPLCKYSSIFKGSFNTWQARHFLPLCSSKIQRLADGAEECL